MAKTKLFSLVSLLLLIAGIFCACSSSSSSQDLRQQYPYAEKSPLVDMNEDSSVTLKDFEKINSVFAVVTVKGSWQNETLQEIPAEGLDPTEVQLLYLPVHIDSVMNENEEFQVTTGDAALRFGTNLMETGYDYFSSGQRFLVALTEISNEDSARYQASMMYTFLITDNDQLVSLTDDAPFDQYTGMKLSEFKKELLKELG